MNTDSGNDTVGVFRSSVSAYLEERYSFEARRQRLNAPSTFSASVWDDFASLGWLAIALPSEYGGLDADPEMIGVLAQELGAVLCMEPVLTSALLCARLISVLGSSKQKTKLLPDIALGRSIFAFAHFESTLGSVDAPLLARVLRGKLTGSKFAVVHGEIASHFLVTARNENMERGLYVVSRAEVAPVSSHYRLVDGRGVADVQFDSANCEHLDRPTDFDDAFEQVLDETSAAYCDEGLGVIRAMNRMTRDYLKNRIQFGRPIGSNQALQHRAVDLYMLEAEVAAVTDYARSSLKSESATRVRAVSGAMAVMIHAARSVAHEAVQLHGAIGMVDELPLSHFFKRVMVLERLLGSRAYHLTRFHRAGIQLRAKEHEIR